MNKKLKILQISGDAVGGIRLHVHGIVNELLSLDHNVYYVCSTNSDIKGGEDLIEFQLKGLNLLLLNIKKKPVFSDVLNICKIIYFIKKHNVMIVHGHGAKGGLYARLVGFLCGAKVVYTPHGGVFHNVHGPVLGRIYSFVERILYPLTSIYLFESKYTKGEFIKLVKPKKNFKLLVNYNGIKFYKPSPKILKLNSDRKISLVVAAMLRKEKGQEVLFRAVRLLKLKGLDLLLHVCGDGPSLSALRKLSVELDIDSNIIFHGDVKNIDRIFEISSMVIIPSLYESFGYVVLEAARANRPVIASNVGGLKELIIDNETGLLFQVGDSNDLASKIEKLIFANDGSVDQMIQKAFNHCALRFSSEKMFSKVLGVYMNLLK